MWSIVSRRSHMTRYIVVLKNVNCKPNINLMTGTRSKRDTRLSSRRYGIFPRVMHQFRFRPFPQNRHDLLLAALVEFDDLHILLITFRTQWKTKRASSASLNASFHKFIDTCALLRLTRISMRSDGSSDNIVDKCSMASLYFWEPIASSPSLSSLFTQRC